MCRRRAIDILSFRGAAMSRGAEEPAVNLLRCPAVASVIDEMAGSEEGPRLGPWCDDHLQAGGLSLGRSLSRPV